MISHRINVTLVRHLVVEINWRSVLDIRGARDIEIQGEFSETSLRLTRNILAVCRIILEWRDQRSQLWSTRKTYREL